MTCRFCGSSLPEGALFCGECGRAVSLDARTPATPSSSVIVPTARSARGLGATALAETETAVEPQAAVLDDAPAEADDPDDGGWDDDDDDDDEIESSPSTGLSIADLAFSSPGETSAPDYEEVRELPSDADGEAPEPEPEPKPKAEADVARCPQCGEPIDDGDVFCGECGFVLRTVLPPAGGATDDGSSEDDWVVLLPALNDLGSFPLDPEAPAVEGEGEGEDDGGAPVEPEDVVEPDHTTEIEPLPEPEPAADPEPEPEASIDSLVLASPPPLPAALPHADPDMDFDEPLPFALPISKPNPVTRARPIPDPFPWGIDRSLGEDIEATRLVADPASGTRYVLQFSTGESITVVGSGLVGRNPSMQPGEYVDQLVPIFDAGKSVSKTHLEFGQEEGRFWVSDRYSTNGSVIRQPDAEPRRCDAGRRYFIARGTRVDVGEQFFVVS